MVGPRHRVALATPLAAASIVGGDLVPALTDPVRLIIVPPGGPSFGIGDINTPSNLTISNNSATASDAGATVTVTYPPSLLTLDVTGAGIGVAGTDGNYTITLPSIPGGGSLTIPLNPVPDALLDGDEVIALLNEGTQQMIATVAGDGQTDNNVAATDLNFSLFP